mgnify:CR=1 FL=1
MYISPFTAVGMANQVPVMVAAIIVAVLFMMWLSASVAAFVDRHPTVKMLALSFLILVGVALIGEAEGGNCRSGGVSWSGKAEHTARRIQV